MIFIGYYRELTNGPYPSMKEFFEDKSYKNKEKIVSYLKNGRSVLASTGILKDVFTDEVIHISEELMTDDVYSWPNVLAYYVDKYNLRLPKEFGSHILAN